MTAKETLARRRFLMRLYRSRFLFSMLIPAVLYYVIFHYIPIYGVTIAFKDFKFSAGILGSPWVGMKWFVKLFAMKSFWEVFSNTLIISVFKLICSFPAPIIFALLLMELNNVRFKKVVQTISYLPHFLSWVVLGGVFIQLLSPTSGPFGLAFNALGLQPIFFLGDNRWFRATLVATSVWKGMGWGSIIYLAALTAVNPELYEAALIDGANRLQRILHISIPSILPVISIMLIFAVGGIVSDDFDQVFNLYNPSVYKTGDVLSTYVYRQGIEKMEYGLSTAAGVFRNVISFILIIATNYASRRMGEYGIW